MGCGSAGEGGGGRMDERVAGSNHEHIIHDGRISLARIGLAPVPLPLWWRQTSEEFTLKTWMYSFNPAYSNDLLWCICWFPTNITCFSEDTTRFDAGSKFQAPTWDEFSKLLYAQGRTSKHMNRP